MKRRLVIIGNGMAGTLLVDEVLARGGADRWQITVVGDEHHEAYNRILLSGVLAGTHREDDLLLQPPGWYGDAGVTALLGTRAVRIHRSTRTVHLDDGSYLPYDQLILATGSTPLLPPLPGLIDRAGGGAALHPQAFAFRTLDDCRAMVSAAGTARRAVVVGGGLLGLEAARGLAGRGVRVEVVQMPEWLMNGQLDPQAGEVLRRTLEPVGITCYLGTRATHIESDAAGTLTGLRLADGHVLDTDLVVFAAGVRPNIRLARDARLDTGRGIKVHDTLTTPADPAISAIGDCAEVVARDEPSAGRGVCSGLVGPAWDQAATLARALTGDPDGPPPCYTPSPVVTRLKASGIDLASMGDIRPMPADTDQSLEVVAFSDFSRGIYKKVVLREGRVVGGLLLGDVGSVGALTLAFDRQTPVPPDRLHLLFHGAFAGAAGTTAADVTQADDDETVCHCNAVTAGRIRACIDAGATEVAAVAAETRATTGCGTCATSVTALLAHAREGIAL